jgi:anti-sigma factor RsiW
MSALTPDFQPSSDIEPDVASDLAALADGSLDPNRRDEVTKQAARSPELGSALAEQQRAIALLSRAAEVNAPEPVREAVQQLADERGIHFRRPWRNRRGAVSSGGEQRVQPRRRVLGVAAATGALVAVAAVTLAVVLSGGTSTTPGLHSYLALAAGPATIAPPAESATHRNQLEIGVGRVAFPYWEDRFGWQATGARVDRVGGRAVTTVYYGNPSGARISYSIVAGSAPRVAGLAALYHRTTPVSRGGVRYWLASVGGAKVVIWKRSGHRCILSSRGVRPSQLLSLASWNGEGGATA